MIRPAFVPRCDVDYFHRLGPREARFARHFLTQLYGMSFDYNPFYNGEERKLIYREYGAAASDFFYARLRVDVPHEMFDKITPATEFERGVSRLGQKKKKAPEIDFVYYEGDVRITRYKLAG